MCSPAGGGEATAVVRLSRGNEEEPTGSDQVRLRVVIADVIFISNAARSSLTRLLSIPHILGKK